MKLWRHHLVIRKRRGRSLLHYQFHINFFVHNINYCQWKSNWRLRPSILWQNYGIKKDKHKHITQTLLTINCVHLGTHTGNWSIIIIIIILVVSCQWIIQRAKGNYPSVIIIGIPLSVPSISFLIIIHFSPIHFLSSKKFYTPWASSWRNIIPV